MSLFSFVMGDYIIASIGSNVRSVHQTKETMYYAKNYLTNSFLPKIFQPRYKILLPLAKKYRIITRVVLLQTHTNVCLDFMTYQPL